MKKSEDTAKQQELIAEAYQEKFGTQEYSRSNLKHTYEEIVIKAIDKYVDHKENGPKPKVTREEFEIQLNKIGWKIEKSWNGLNDRLITPSGAVTDWRVNTDDIEPYSTQLYGGVSWVCSVKFQFDSMEILEEDTISLGGNGGYVLFMNHDKKRN